MPQYNKRKTDDSDMIYRKANKRVVELSTMEAKLLRTALIHFRNKVLNAGKPTEDIESLLLMLM